jgi:N6-L-threonylcarbamoyladenine synthase
MSKRGRGLILGIESSCDETAAAVVERGARTLSSAVASQIPTHARYGGVVPELASREHLRAIVPVVRAALEQAGVTLDDLDAIAVTAGPGLAGALLVGVTYAKALAFAQGLPLVAINHLEGHIHAVLLHEHESSAKSLPDGQSPSKICQESGAQESRPSKGTGFSPYIQPPNEGGALAPEENALSAAQSECSTAQSEQPALALVVSGGHTHLFLARQAHGSQRHSWSYSLVGRTLDDAAGEAYDKVAKLLGLGYPGGPWIDALARFGNPHAVPFAFSQIKTKLHLAGKPPRTKAARTAPIANLNPHFLFSFSGIKTAVLRYVELHELRSEAQARAARLFSLSSEENAEDSESRPAPKPPQTKAEALTLCSRQTLDLIASFQCAVIGDLMKKSFAAAEALGIRRLLITGGVAANRELRARFSKEAARRGLRVAFPTLSLSTDNAAMIAAAAWPRFLSGEFADSALSADPSLALGAIKAP